jgi:hypothetical protein
MGSTQPVHDTFPFDRWSTPGFVIDHQTPRVAESTPAGSYTLQLRLMDQIDDTIMTADLGQLLVHDSDRIYTPPKTAFPMDAEFGKEIEFLGYDLESSDLGRYNLRLVWRAAREPSENYTVFVHLLDRDGTCCLWQSSEVPRQGSSPTDDWLPGEVVIDEYEIEIPEELAAGQYALEIGFFLAESGVRLLVDVPGMRQQDSLLLTRPLVVE